MSVGAEEQSPQFESVMRAAQALFRGDDYFREVLESLPAAVYITDHAGRITFFNEAAVALWGRRPEPGSEWRGLWKLFRADGTPLPVDEYPIAQALREGRPIRGVEAVGERPDGTRVPFLPFPTPLYDESGTLIGAVNMLIDLTDRKRAEQYERRLAAIVESSDDAILSKDLNGIINSWNSGAERLFGYTAEEVIGKSILMLIPPDHADEEPKILERIRRGERIEHYETIRRRKDGTLVEISLSVSPLRNAEGRVIGASKIARDITERRRAQEQQTLLLRELKHRIKNTLATVQAIVRQTLRGATPEEQAAFVGRIQALARAQDVLTDENWNRAPLRAVVIQAVEAFNDANRERILLDGSADIWLDADQSFRLTMALHELATNAVKYGALSTPGGQVRVSWELLQDSDKRARLHWQEIGGPPVTPPRQKGFGSLLIERILEGGTSATRLEFKPEGVACVFEVPL